MQRFSRWSMISSALVGLILTAAASAAPVTIQPVGAAGRDAFVYSFLATTNFTTAFGGAYGGLLATGLTTSGHNLESLVKFDLSGVTLAKGETATLNLYVGDTVQAQFGVNPSVAFPVTTNVAPASDVWAYDAVTWNTRPGTTTPSTSFLVDGINKWVSVDVTSIVNGWVTGGVANNGFSLRQDAIVQNNGSVVAVYNSSRAGGTTPVLSTAPYLQIVAVPEPASMGGLVIGGAAALLRRRKA